MSQTTAQKDFIIASNQERYPTRVYHEVTSAVGNQHQVATKWGDGALPSHSTSGDAVKLYTSTENLVGLQYPDGSGKLKHYAHIEAIRTRSGLLISDSSCYAKGRAKCSTPSCDVYFDVTSLKSNIRHEDESVYGIREVRDEGEVVFETGRVFDLGDEEWVVPEEDQPSPLGL
jgi:hypothetical protein